MSASTFALPRFPGTLWPLCLVSVVQGAALGAIDPGRTILVLSLWPDRHSERTYAHTHFSVGPTHYNVRTHWHQQGEVTTYFCTPPRKKIVAKAAEKKSISIGTMVGLGILASSL